MAKKIDNNILSAKQKLFCAEYVVDFNGTKAAIRAGYAEKSAAAAAARMLTYNKVEKEISRLINEKLGTKKQEIQYKVINELVRIAFADVTEDNKIVDREVIDPVTGKTITVQTLQVKNTKDQKHRKAVSSIESKDGSIRMRYYDKIKALELLGKYGSVFTDEDKNKLEITGKLFLSKDDEALV